MVEVGGALVGGLGFGLPAMEVGFQLGERYGSQFAHSAADQGLKWLGQGLVSPQTALRAARYIFDPQVQRNVAGLALGTLGMAVGIVVGMAVVDSVTSPGGAL